MYGMPSDKWTYHLRAVGKTHPRTIWREKHRLCVDCVCCEHVLVDDALNRVMNADMLSQFVMELVRERSSDPEWDMRTPDDILHGVLHELSLVGDREYETYTGNVTWKEWRK